MPDPIPNPAADDLALTALRFAAGDLSPDRAEAFAERIGRDQAARDALADAIRLSAAALGQAAPTPDPQVRAAACEELRPTVMSRLFPRQRYRGHPALWAGLGGTVAAAVTVFGVWLGDQPPEPQPTPAPAPLAVTTPPAVPAPVVVARTPDPEPAAEPTTVAVELAPPPSPADPSAEPVVAAQEPDRPPSAAEGKGGRKPAEAKIGDD